MVNLKINNKKHDSQKIEMKKARMGIIRAFDFINN